MTGVNVEYVKPNQLPVLTRDEVLARAQRIYDKRGEPPYSANACIDEDEAQVLTEAVYYWLPYLERK